MTAAAQARPMPRPRARGPVMFAAEVVMGLLFVALGAWAVGVLIEIGGSFVFEEFGERHALRLVEQDLAYIEAAPRSLIVGDTVAWSNEVLAYVRLPFEKLGVIAWYARWNGPDAHQAQADATQDAADAKLPRGVVEAKRVMAQTASRWLVIAMLVAQDVLLRLSVAIFALPAFALACLLGTLDGMVRRDLRRWSGGRESSFIYHHAKHYTAWALTGGFGLYLSWPFGGFNPAWMVLAFTALVAASLSTTVGAFKKYL